jgi:hypothetical protein
MHPSRMVLRTVAVVALMFALGYGWLHASQNAANVRQSLAESWSSDDAQFSAIGLRGDSLAAFLPNEDSTECDAFLDTLLTDKPMVNSLRAQGFREISCGQRKAGL